MSDVAGKMIGALGGRENISELDACITRLRVVVRDPRLISDKELKALGAIGVMKVGQAIQVILGTQADRIEGEMRALLHLTPAALRS
ncbi:MAG TPA: PTS glucose/sucrose transporter subunit IIB [Symbiobacteriaceae bacterium]